MKKLLAAILVIILTASFAACSSGNETKSSDITTGSYAEKSSNNTEKMETAASETEKAIDNNNTQQSSGGILPEFDKTYTIEETQLTETYGVTVTATKLEYTQRTAELTVKLENNSDSKKEVLAGTAGYGCNSINGYMMHSGYLNCELEAGASSEEEISFSFDEMFLHGINCIADIGVGFEVDDEDNNREYSGMTSIKTKKADDYNYDEDTFLKAMKDNSLKSAYEMTLDAIAENNLYNDAGISLIAEVTATNKDGEKSLMLEFKSEADYDKYVKITGLSINGQEVSTYQIEADFISIQKKAVVSVELNSYFEDYPELAGQDIKIVEFSVSSSNFDSWEDTEKVPVKIEF